MVDATTRFKDLVKSAFAKRRATKVHISIITKLFYDFKYKTSGIETTLQEAFGQGYLFGQLEEERRNSGDGAKVAVVTCTNGRHQPCLIANYNRNPAAKLQDGREGCKLSHSHLLKVDANTNESTDDCLLRAENQSDDFRIWQA